MDNEDYTSVANNIIFHIIQDSYNSDSVGLSGPTGGQLKLIQKENPYGFTSLMACNMNNQMIGNGSSLLLTLAG